MAGGGGEVRGSGPKISRIFTCASGTEKWNHLYGRTRNRKLILGVGWGL